MDDEMTEKRWLLLLTLLVIFAVAYFNLTPFASVDCWWHMRAADHFWKTGRPVIQDPFAVQTGEKILAVYPSLLPGTLFLVAHKAFFLTGLNLLRIAVFVFFILILVRLAAARGDHVGLFLAALLAFAMAGQVVLRPDLFNFPLFALWIWLWERLAQGAGRRSHLAGLLLVELCWVCSHPLFFYYGLVTAGVYLIFICRGVRNNAPSTKAILGKRVWLLPLLAGSIWLVNPLGWRALQSLPVNMISSDYHPGSMRPIAEAFQSFNTYALLLVMVVALWVRPWQRLPGKTARWRFFLLLVLVLLPAFFFARALPFAAIFLVVQRSVAPDAAEVRPRHRWPRRLLVVAFSFFLILDRNSLLSVRLVGGINSRFGVRLGEHFQPAGVRIFEALPDESLREAAILKRLGLRGNFFSNHLGLSSAAVWFDRDLTVYWYGHAALINARSNGARRFLVALEAEKGDEVARFLDRYNIRAVALTNYLARYFKLYRSFHKSLTLLYIDPYFAVFVRRGTLDAAQWKSVADFYRSFWPGEADALRFDIGQRVRQLAYLWFGAVMTGSDGSRFRDAARPHIEDDEWRRFEEMAASIIRSERERPPQGPGSPINFP